MFLQDCCNLLPFPSCYLVILSIIKRPISLLNTPTVPFGICSLIPDHDIPFKPTIDHVTHPTLKCPPNLRVDHLPLSQALCIPPQRNFSTLLQTQVVTNPSARMFEHSTQVFPDFWTSMLLKLNFTLHLDALPLHTNQSLMFLATNHTSFSITCLKELPPSDQLAI